MLSGGSRRTAFNSCSRVLEIRAKQPRFYVEGSAEVGRGAKERDDLSGIPAALVKAARADCGTIGMIGLAVPPASCPCRGRSTGRRCPAWTVRGASSVPNRRASRTVGVGAYPRHEMPWLVAVLQHLRERKIVELLNSALEATVDRISLDEHPLAQRAKDIGSAAVFLSLVNVGVVWLLVLLD